MVQGLSRGAGGLLETICLGGKSCCFHNDGDILGSAGAAQTQAPCSLYVLATMHFSVVFNMGFHYVAWSSVAQAGLPAPNAGIKACASYPAMQLSERHHPGNCSKMQR